MNKYLLLFIGCLLCHAYAFPQTPMTYNIAVMGSSTVAGEGALPNPNPTSPQNPPDSCWASIVLRYYKSFGLLDSLYNLGRSGSVTFDGLPNGSFFPNGTPVDSTTYDYNMTWALAPERADADLVIISYASNDVAELYTTAQTMATLRTLYNIVVNAGKRAYVTTTQPRTSWANGRPDLVNEAQQREERDSILLEFGSHALNFYDPIANASGNGINPLYNYDGTHVNNLGHQALAQVVESANLFGEITPLALTLINFTAGSVPQGIRLNWTAAGEQGPVIFDVQRGRDGNSFDDLWQENVIGSLDATGYSWTDQSPLAGKGYYRLKVTDAGGEHFSPIVAIGNTGNGWGIGKIMVSPGANQLMVEIFSPASQNSTVTITDAAGKRVRQQLVSLTAPSVTAPVSLAGLAAGAYFLHIVTDQGNVATRAFMKFQ